MGLLEADVDVDALARSRTFSSRAFSNGQRANRSPNSKCAQYGFAQRDGDAGKRKALRERWAHKSVCAGSPIHHDPRAASA
jgi:hypothetical protein